MRRPISVAVPNWDGEEVLPECLSSLLRALDQSGYAGSDVVVVDDASDDRSVDVIRSSFPQVRLVVLGQRSGFIVAANTAVEHCENDYVLLLNNDVSLETDFFEHWEHHFNDPDTFAVASWMLRWNGVDFDSGRRVGVWDRGLIRHWVVGDRGQPAPTLYACGGAAIYDRHKFEALNGFDLLYRPMYVEDFDLSYRAWKRGWKVVYEPACVVYHRSSYSSNRVYEARRKALINTRNNFLFVWKNITDPMLMRHHLLWLPLRLVSAPFCGRRMLLAAFFYALPKLREALVKRREEREFEKVSDRMLFDLFRPTAYDLRHSHRTGLAGAS